MQPQGENEYKQLLTDVIKKQIVILGPDITLVKARNVPGLTVTDDGTVTAISGQPQQITQNLIDQFVQLSGLIVKKTMEPLLSYHQQEKPADTEVTTSNVAAADKSTEPQKTDSMHSVPSVTTASVSPNPMMPSTPKPSPMFPSMGGDAGVGSTQQNPSMTQNMQPGGMPLNPQPASPAMPPVIDPTKTMPSATPIMPPAEPTPTISSPISGSTPMPVNTPPAQPNPPAEDHKDQIDAETQKIIDDALKSSA